MAEKKKAAKRSGAGRPTHKELGIEPTKTVTLRLGLKEIELAKKKYGTLRAAIQASIGY